MNFDFSEEQEMLRDSVARFVKDDYSFDKRRAIVATESGMDRDIWQTFAELGWLSVPFDEEYGGFGGGTVDLMVMMEELGKGLVVEPYFATVVLFGGLLQAAGNDEQKAAFIPSIVEGKTLGAFAYLERQSRHELSDIATSAVKTEEGYVLDGEKVVVFNGANADTLIVAARNSGAQSDPAGISLFLVSADAPGVTRQDYQLMDGQRVANIRFSDVSVGKEALLGSPGAGFDIMQKVVLEATVALAAEAVGLMAQLNAKTLEYTKTREQFGQPIGQFQALQHRMVDTFMSYEQAKSMLYRAVCALKNGSPEIRREVHALKVIQARSGRHIFEEAIQLHGGMGLTDELDIAHYAKRLMMINTTFGDLDYHQGQFQALSYGKSAATGDSRLSNVA